MTSKGQKTKSLVNKATSDDRNPPSGYLLKELSSRTLSISECQTIEDLVVKKLAKNKPYVKYKALRIVKFLCENGSPNWRRAWQRNTDKLRDAQQFRGPPDPIYGDAPYQQVRKAAKDAMQAVFQQSQIDSSHIKTKIKGMGGDSAYGSASNTYSSSSFGSSKFGNGSKGTFGGSSTKKDPPSAPASWGKSMPGHGNTSYQPNVDKKATFQALKSSTYTNPANFSGKSLHSSGKLDTRSSGKRKSGRPGGVWGDDGSQSDQSNSEPNNNEYEPNYDDFPTSTSYEQPKKKTTFGGNMRKNSTRSSGQYEKKWVDNIVKSGGVGCKIIGLPKYVKEFENLSKNHILEYLDEKLEDGTWQKQGKALALIVALLDGKSSDDVIDYFSQSPENVQALQNAKKSILRRKANAVMEYLEVDEDGSDDGTEGDDDDDNGTDSNDDRGRDHIDSAENDMLNMGNNNNEDDGNGMFDNMNVVNDVSTNNNNNGATTANLLDPDMFPNMNATSTNNQTTSNNTDDIMNLIGDVTVSNNNAPQNDVQQQQQLQAEVVKKEEPKRPKSNFAFLDQLANDANVGQTNEATNILGMGFGVNANANANAQKPEKENTTESAFGFMNNGNMQSMNDQSGTNGVSAFGFMNEQSAQDQNPSQASQQQNGGGGGGGSAFGLDLGAATSSTQQSSANQSGSNSMNASMSSMNMMNKNQGSPLMNAMQSNMMTSQMMQQSNQMNQMLNNNVGQMNQMQAMMQAMNLNPMQMQQMQQMMMNQQNMNINQQMPMQNNNLFQSAMANVNNTQQPQRQMQNAPQYGHNDPFANIGKSNQSAPSIPKKTGPDPFAQFGLSSMQ